MHESEGAVVAAMGVGVALGRHAMRGPAGMPHGAGGRGHRLVGELFFERGQLAHSAHHMDVVLAHKSHARGIITPVFKPAQPFHHNGNSWPVSCITYNTAHTCLLIYRRSLRLDSAGPGGTGTSPPWGVLPCSDKEGRNRQAAPASIFLLQARGPCYIFFLSTKSSLYTSTLAPETRRCMKISNSPSARSRATASAMTSLTISHSAASGG